MPNSRVSLQCCIGERRRYFSSALQLNNILHHLVIEVWTSMMRYGWYVWCSPVEKTMSWSNYSDLVPPGCEWNVMWGMWGWLCVRMSAVKSIQCIHSNVQQVPVQLRILRSSLLPPPSYNMASSSQHQPCLHWSSCFIKRKKSSTYIQSINISHASFSSVLSQHLSKICAMELSKGLSIIWIEFII